MSNWTDGQISTTANFIADQIEGLIGPYGGVCEVVDDEDLMWRQAFQSSKNLVVYVTWGGDVPHGTFGLAGVTHRVVRQWILGIKRGRGYTETRGDTFSKTTSVPPFADMVDAIRNLVRAMIGISQDFGTDNVIVKKWSQGPLVMSGRLLTFTTQCDLPGVVMSPDNIPNPITAGLAPITG
jgi:hypothetical protein